MQLWSREDCYYYIPLFVLGFILFLTFRILKNKLRWQSHDVQKYFRVVMLIFACILITGEIMKTVTLYVYDPITDPSKADWKYLLPFHVCSYFMWFMLAIAIAKPNSIVAKLGTYGMYCVGGFLVFGAMLSPEIVFNNIMEQIVNNKLPGLGDRGFYGCYSLFYHSTVILLVSSIWGLRPYHMQFRDWWKFLSVFLGLLLITVFVSSVTTFEYEQFNPTMDILINIEKTLGKAAYTVVLILFFCAVNMLSFVGNIVIPKLEKKCFIKYRIWHLIHTET